MDDLNLAGLGEGGVVATIIGPAAGWPPPAASAHDADAGTDWLVVVVATIAFLVLALGIGMYVYPNSESGRYDNCVQQRAPTFLEKVSFPVISAVRECDKLRDQGALN